MLYAPKKRASKHMKQKLIELQRQTDKSIIRGFNTSQKLTNRESARIEKIWGTGWLSQLSISSPFGSVVMGGGGNPGIEPCIGFPAGWSACFSLPLCLLLPVLVALLSNK